MSTIENATTALAGTRRGDGQAESGARLQYAHLQWEQQWLRANRDAQRVIDQDPESRVNEHSPPPGSDMRARAAVATAEAVAKRVARPPLDITAVSVARIGAAPEQVGPAAPVVDAAPVSGPPQPLDDNAVLTAREDTAARELTATRREAQKPFVFWYADARVGAALRLPAATDSGSVVAQLRQWLKAAGLKLVRLIINGELRWRDEPPRRDGY